MSNGVGIRQPNGNVINPAHINANVVVSKIAIDDSFTVILRVTTSRIAAPKAAPNGSKAAS